MTSYCRMVLRVPMDLPETIQTISERLFHETRVEYSYSTIVRGLIALGVRQVAAAEFYAPLFDGSIGKRGRKPGKARSKVAKTLNLDGKDIDVEEDDKFHDALVAKQVVKRELVRRRRSALHEAALVERTPLRSVGGHEQDEDRGDEDLDEEGDEEVDDSPDTERGGKPS